MKCTLTAITPIRCPAYGSLFQRTLKLPPSGTYKTASLVLKSLAYSAIISQFLLTLAHPARVGVRPLLDGFWQFRRRGKPLSIGFEGAHYHISSRKREAGYLSR